MGARHGLTKHPLYKKWKKLLAKCKYPYQDGYALYGAEGVTMCQEWENDFTQFFDWVVENGWAPDKIITIKQGSKTISPETCVLLTHQERQGRKSTTVQVEWKGETYCLKELCEKLGKNYFTVASRVNSLKWSLEDALTIETKKIGRGAIKYGNQGITEPKADVCRFNLIFEKESSPERNAQQNAFGVLLGIISHWFSLRTFKCDLVSRMQLYVTANSQSEILRSSGLDHFILEPVLVGADICDAVTDTPYLKFAICCSPKAHEVIAALTAIPPFTTKSILVPVVAKKVTSGRLEANFLFPLKPLLNTPDMASALCMVVSEIYLQYVLDFFSSSSLNSPIPLKHHAVASIPDSSITNQTIIPAQPDKLRENFQRWYAENKEIYNERRKQKYHEDPEYRKRVVNLSYSTKEKYAEQRAGQITREWQGRIYRVYRIGDVAAKIGVSLFAIRDWEQQGIIPPSQFPGKQRVYTEKQIKLLQALASALSITGKHTETAEQIKFSMHSKIHEEWCLD